MQDSSMLYVAVPAMDEPGLARTLSDIADQSRLPAWVGVCINQPESYLHDGDREHARIAESNQETFRRISAMQAEKPFPYALEIIDRFRPGKAWDSRHFGVGWARKTVMDRALEVARQKGEDLRRAILVCMDADTRYPENYLESIQKQFSVYPQAVGLANPYYHETAGAPASLALAMLRYESYMKAYALNLLRSGHPYAFTAVGSSMACTLEAYRRIGGITPFKSGEDFYFLQKLSKYGPLIRYSPALSHPACRLSSRVFFGTGPALGKGLEGHWESYPFYPYRLFSRMQDAYSALPGLFRSGVPDSRLDFWQAAFGPLWWEKPRRHAGGNARQFVKTCIGKFDALRSLQFLKASYRQDDRQDWENLRELVSFLLFSSPASAGWNEDSEPGSRFAARMEALVSDASIKGLPDLSLQDWQSLRDFLHLSEYRWLEKQALLP